MRRRLEKIERRTPAGADRVDSIAIVGVDPQTGAKGEPVVIWERPGTVKTA